MKILLYVLFFLFSSFSWADDEVTLDCKDKGTDCKEIKVKQSTDCAADEDCNNTAEQGRNKKYGDKKITGGMTYCELKGDKCEPKPGGTIKAGKNSKNETIVTEPKSSKSSDQNQ